MGLYIDDLKRFENSIVGITIPTVGVLQGIITDTTFSVGGTASIDDALASSAIKIAKGALAASVGYAPLIGQYAKAKLERRLSPLSKSAQGWVSGSSTQFSVNFKVFKRGTHAVGSVATYKDLQRYVSSLTQTKSSPNEPFQQPAYYDVLDYEKSLLENKFDSAKAGLITLAIGKYFSMSGLLADSASVEYSTLTDKNGDPLYATVSASFRAFRDLNVSEISGAILV